MKKLKDYLLSRLTSEIAVIGMIFLVLEIVLHLGSPSALVILVCLLMIAVPEALVRAQLKAFVARITD